MTAAAADRKLDKLGSDIVQGDLAAAVVIYQGTMVMRDSSGNLKPGADSAAHIMAGVSRGDPVEGKSTVDNSGGAAGDKTVELSTKGVFGFDGTATKADIGKKAYITDDSTVSTTPANVFAGVIADVRDSQVYIDIEPAVYEGQ